MAFTALTHPSVTSAFRYEIIAPDDESITLGSPDLMRTVASASFTCTAMSSVGASYRVSTVYPAVTPVPHSAGWHVSVVLMT